MRKFGWLLGISGAIACATGIAQADMLTPIGVGNNLILGQSWTSSGPGQTPTTVTGTGVNGDGAGVGISDLTASSAGSYNFTQTFAAPTASYAAASTINGNPYGFVASYVIDVAPSMANAYVFSLNLSSTVGIDNLTAALYEYNANGIKNLTLGGTGAPDGGGLLDSWSGSVNGAVASTSLPNTNLTNGGEFVLEIAGIETGSVNGTYNGALDITPVPLPAALPLLLSGLGGLGWWGRRAKSR